MPYQPIDYRKRVEQEETALVHGVLRIPEPVIPKPTTKDEILNAVAKMKKAMKIGASDPGKQRDAYGFVGVKYEAPYILITGAQRWIGNKYLTVEEKISQIHHQFGFDLQIVELNSMGHHVWEVLKYVKNLPIIGVNASKDLKHEQLRKFDPTKFPTMDNNDVTRWMHLQHEMGNFIFGNNPTKEVNELKNQIANIVEYKTEGTGSVSYRAEGQEHDDLFTSLRLICWYIKENLMKPQTASPPVVSGAKYYREELEPNDRIIEAVKKQMGGEFANVQDIQIDHTY